MLNRLSQQFLFVLKEEIIRLKASAMTITAIRLLFLGALQQ